MGVVKNVGFDTMPKQSNDIGAKVEVCFNYDTSRKIIGTVVRDDMEAPGVQIFRLSDGRHILSTECQYSYAAIGAKIEPKNEEGEYRGG